MRIWPCWITYLVSVKDATTNFDRFVGSGSHYLLPLNFFWFLRRCIVGWTIVIVFFIRCLGLVYSCSSLCWIRQCDWFVALGDLIILHRFLLICTGYRTPSVFLTRSVCLCSNVWKAWPLPIFLISALPLQLLWVILVWDLQLEVISLCRDSGLSGVQGLLLWLVRNVGTNCQLDSGICRLVLRLSLNTWKHTCSELVFLIKHALFEFVLHFVRCVTMSG